MARIRPFRVGDEPALADICLRTADAGGDATGLLGHDAIWAEVFVLPYVARHPQLAFVVEDDGRVVGYVVATPDTDAFEEWFRTQWWPEHGRVFAREGAAGREREILAYADGRGTSPSPYRAAHPAHLHIDLLPETQGRGWGRMLIQHLLDALRADGVPGLHLVASADNEGAVAFYERLGFRPLPSDPGDRAFGIDL